MPLVVGLLQLVDASALAAQIQLEPMDRLFGHSQVGLDLFGARDGRVCVGLQRSHGILLILDARLQLLDALFASGDLGDMFAALSHRLSERAAHSLHLRANGLQLDFELIDPLALRSSLRLELLAPAPRFRHALLLLLAQLGGRGDGGLQ